ncbi:DNA repair protein rad9 like [Verticillium longisporum]|uniref:DNA repair protein rad9 n=1 Tax=Verticillium longisporum TaxID=100787 RepID=A0A8I2ZBH7_VERLO|nr:DNA repair protein rad9 like [Verticillium longisporum]
MPLLAFTLIEDAVSALRDALICLNKFSDDVSFEAQKDKFVLTALNSSKSAYACFTFSTARFCSRYAFDGRDKFYCTLYTRALISIFRSRASGDPQRGIASGADRPDGRDGAIDRCEVSVEDGPGVQVSRFVAKLIFRNGLASTHRLPFEVAVPVHAKFSREEAGNHWTIPSRTLRQLMEHFGPGVELLDICSDGEHVKFTCFTEKTVNGDEVLKKPLHTSIAIEIDEFEDIEVEDKLRIVMNVRDFRAIIQHAGIAGTNLSARYSTPARPIQVTYPGDGIACEFLLMTVGERGGNPAQKTRKGSKAVNGARQRQQLEPTSRRESAAPSQVSERQPDVEDQAPPKRPPPTSTMRSEGLFVEDDRWEPVNDDEEEEENARLEWDHSAQPEDTGPHINQPAAENSNDVNPTPASSYGFEPTQRLSGVERLGLFYRGS